LSKLAISVVRTADMTGFNEIDYGNKREFVQVGQLNVTDYTFSEQDNHFMHESSKYSLRSLF